MERREEEKRRGRGGEKKKRGKRKKKEKEKREGGEGEGKRRRERTGGEERCDDSRCEDVVGCDYVHVVSVVQRELLLHPSLILEHV